MTQGQARSARVALVTGGSRGIGRETAVRLAADGYAIAVVYASASVTAGQVVEDITRMLVELDGKQLGPR